MTKPSDSPKLPHMPLWVYDIRADEDCIVMPDQEFGRYMRLLIHQWVEGSVPADAAVAARACGLDPDSVQAVRSLLDRKFTVTDGKRRQNTRLAHERDSAIQKVEKNRRNGALGGRPPKNRKETQGQTQEKPNGLIPASGSDSGSDSQSSSSGGSAEGGKANAPPAHDYPPPLDTPAFRAKWAEYQAYRRECGWGALKPRSIKQKLKELADNGHDEAIRAIDTSIANGWRGLFPGKGGAGATGDRQSPGAGTAAERAAARRGEIAGEEIDLPVLRYTDAGGA